MRQVMTGLALVILPSTAPALAADQPTPIVQAEAQGIGQAIVQIGGRQCEYHRSEVEGALRQFDAVRQVDFLNDHGTVLVRFIRGAVQPEQLARSVERTLAMGWGCKAWVER